MVYVKNTPNNTGVAVYGDYMDFENFYEALHTVVGDEDEFVGFEAARTRVLGVCYDIRHALMGDREIEFVDNGMDEEKKRRMSVLASDKNVYLKIYVLWPEILFVTMALNDFIRLYARKKAKKSFMKCIKDTVADTSFRRMMNLINKDYTWFGGYTRQYLDILNCRFIDMHSEKRLKSIPTMAKRLAERGEEYNQIKSEVAAAARHYNTCEDNINPPVDYPEDFEW